MGQPLEVHIRKLQEFYWSEADPTGRGFVPLADALRKAGEFQESRRILREGLRRHPEFLAGHVVSAWLSLDEGNLDEAEEHYLDALDLDPRNVAVLRGLSELHLSKGNEQQAVSYLETLIQEDPVDLDLPERLAELKSRLAAEAGSDEDDRRSLGLAVWDDPVRAAGELNWHRATLQDDSSPEEEPEEEFEDEPVAEAEPEAEEAVEEGLVAEEEAEDEPAAEKGHEEPEEVEGPEEVDQPEVEEEPVLEVGIEEQDRPETEPEELEPPVLVVEDGEPIPDAGELEDSLVTSTLGEIYLRQGLLGRAEWVFDSLLQEDPENEHLRKRLEEVQELLAEHGPHKTDASDSPTEPETPEEDVPVGEIMDVPDPSLEGWVPGEVPGEDGEEVGWAEVAEFVPPAEDPQFTEEVQPEIVPIESLAPDRTTAPQAQPMEAEEEEFRILPVGALEPDELPTVDSLAPDDVIVVDELAPEEVFSVDALAPDDVMVVDELAPGEIVSIEALAPDEIISIDALAPDDIISIDALAPEEFISIDALAPDTAGPGPSGDATAPVSIEMLAPDDPVPIEALAPDEDVETGSDSTIDDFERWLEKLQ